MRRSLLLALPFVALGACKDDAGGAPSVLPPSPLNVSVGDTVEATVLASDPDGDVLTYSVSAPGVPDLMNTASIVPAADGTGGAFSFTPVASQVGTHIFDFTVSDGSNEVTVSTTVEVLGGVGSGSAPVFKRPLSQGTVLDLVESSCASFDIEVEDPDSSSVTLGQQAPVIVGSELASTGGLTATWSWCPTREQKDASDQWPLTLTANDGDNATVEKEFVIVLRKPSGEGCPGEFPAVQHDVADFNTVLDLQIDATVSDDMGLSGQPVVLYSFEDPGNPVQFELLSNVATMELVDGDPRSGSWRASIPNPTANEPEGSTARLWYIIQASDDDDVDGDCDHRTDSPPIGAYSVMITNSGGSGGAALCESCSADVQCGSDGDHCLADGSGGSTCGRACDDDCPDGYTCAPESTTSVDGATGRQCVPLAGSCDGGSGGMCEDDFAEDDDNPEQGSMLPPIDTGEYSAILCPDDEDWWLFQLDAEAVITATLSGPSNEDLDLGLTNEDGGLIDQSTGADSDETIVSSCQPAGSYFLRVYDGLPLDGSSDYDLQLEIDTAACMTSSGGSCCEAQDSPGCNDPAIETCVCDNDPWCCGLDDEGEGVWDEFCVDDVGDQGCADPCP
ncbi:MAG: Ig-like domain-containing protein [Myxococcota bacterium]